MTDTDTNDANLGFLEHTEQMVTSAHKSEDSNVLPETDENNENQDSDYSDDTSDELTPKSFTKKMFLRRFFAKTSTVTIEKIIDALTELIEFKRKEALKEAQKSSELEAEVLSVLENIKEKGIDVDILYEKLKCKSIDASLQNYKYEYKDSLGVTQFWSGKGRIPAPMAEEMKKTGKTKKDFLRKIKEKN